MEKQIKKRYVMNDTAIMFELVKSNSSRFVLCTLPRGIAEKMDSSLENLEAKIFNSNWSQSRIIEEFFDIVKAEVQFRCLMAI
jgi:hypothetical protein